MPQSSVALKGNQLSSSVRLKSARKERRPLVSFRIVFIHEMLIVLISETFLWREE